MVETQPASCCGAWLRCRGATTAGRKEDLVKRLTN